MWFFAGVVLGATLALWGATVLQMTEQLDWRCQRYSPLNGECTELRRVDDIP